MRLVIVCWLGLVATSAAASPWRAAPSAIAKARLAAAEDQLLVTEVVDLDGVRIAVNHWQAAQVAAPDDPEPALAQAQVLRAVLFDCDAGCAAAPRARALLLETITAYHRFMELAPRDPRIQSALESCAILHTKVATPEHLTQSAAHYIALLARAEYPSDTVRGNLAEDYMMLGQLDRAIELYREVARAGGVSTKYGYAVALDRSGQREVARAVIAGLGRSGFDDFVDQVQRGEIFFVPVGESYYYLALAAEALGEPALARRYYAEFIASGAHPQFVPIARKNHDALTAP